MSRAWDKEKKSPTGIKPTLSRCYVHCATRRPRGEQGYLLDSYVTRVLGTARIGSVDGIMVIDKEIWQIFMLGILFHYRKRDYKFTIFLYSSHQLDCC